MKDSIKNIMLLYKTNLLNNYRDSYIFRFLLSDKISIGQILIIKIVFLVLYFLLFYLLPMLLSELILSAELDFSAILSYKEFLWNISLILVFFMGMLYSANLIFELTVNENYHILKFPVTLADLVYYRSIEVIFSYLKFCFYFTLPLFLYIALLSNLQLIPMLFYIISYLLISLIFYFAGITGILLLKKYFPKTTSERLLLNIVLGSIILFAITVRIIKDNDISLIDIIQWINVNKNNIYFSPAHLIHSVIIPGGGSFFMDIFSLLIAQTLILFLIVDQTIKSLNRAYKDIHLYSKSKIFSQELKSFITYNWINNYLLFIPIKIRPFFIKDIITLIRKPFFILKFILLILSIITLSLYRIDTKSGIDLNLFFIYLLPTYLISFLFINAIGLEKSNIYLIKRIFPSSLSFLFTRFQVNLICAFIILILIYIFYLIFNFNSFYVAEIIIRLVFVLLSILSITLLVTGYSASFCIFKHKYSNINDIGISPLPMIIFWIISFINPIFFYLLDVFYLDSGNSIYIMFFLNFLGISLFTLITIFMILGRNRIKNLT